MSPQGADNSSQLALLRDPVFRAFWIATAISSVGTLMQNTGASWLMASLTDSAFLIGLVQTATSAPVMLLAPFAGSLADHFNERRRLLIFTQMLLCALAGVLAVLTFLGAIQTWGLLLLLALIGVVGVFNWNFWQKIVEDIVGRPRLAAAVSLNSISFNVAKGVGPALGGALVALLGAGAAFLFNALAYLGIILVALRWKPKAKFSTARRNSGNIAKVVLDGLLYVHSHRLLFWLLIRNLLLNTFISAALALLPLLAKEKLGLGAEGFGMLLTAFGSGCFLGAFFAHLLQKAIGIRKLTRVGLLLALGSSIALALSSHFWVTLPSLFLMGCSYLVVGLNHNLRVRLCVPAEMSGRALAYHQMTVSGGFALGGAVFGGLAVGIGLTGALMIAAVVGVACFILALLHPMPNSSS